MTNFQPIHRFSFKDEAWFLNNIIHMHSLDLFIIKMGTLGSRVRLCLDFRDDTAAPQEPWLAAWVLEIMSPEVIHKFHFWKLKSDFRFLCNHSGPKLFSTVVPDMLTHAFPCLSKHIPRIPKGAPLSSLIEVRKDHTKTQGKTGDAITHCFFY